MSRVVVAHRQFSGDRLVVALEAAGVEVVVLDVDGPASSDVATTDALLAAAADADWVVLSASPAGAVSDDGGLALVGRLVRAGSRVVVDTGGAALLLPAATLGPTLVATNRDELAAVTGLVLETLGDVVSAAMVLQGYGAGSVLVSLGADGAVLVAGDLVAHATCPVDAVRSSVRAGDALLAGFIAAGGAGAEALRTAVSWATTAAGPPARHVPRPEEVRLELATVTTRPDPSTPLSP